MNKITDNLKQRSNRFNVVLNDSSADLFKNPSYLFKSFLNRVESISFLALIQHDNEWDNENQRFKTNHYHLTFTLKDNAVCSLGNMLNRIVDAYHCNANQVSIEKCNDLCGSVRYLIHMDNIDKQSYLPFDILSTDDVLVGEFLSRVREINDIKEVVAIAKRYHYDTESILLHVGSANWRKWRTEFIDLKRDARSY